MISALVSAGLEGGYLASARLAKVHWQAGAIDVFRSSVNYSGYAHSGRNLMRLELLRGCSDGKTCPAVHQTDRGTVVIQGWAVTDAEALRQLGLPDGEVAVEIPAELVAEV